MKQNISRRQFIQSGTLMTAGVLGFPSVILPKKKQKLGVALVGLGQYSRGQLGPGLQLTQNCELRGIVTGSPEKIPVWQERYSIPDRNVYNYETMHQIAENHDIDIVYIVLPPSMHAEYSIIGAEAGKHVWCEKPMAMDVAECRSIIESCQKNKVQLTVGYRMLHEPNTQTIIRYGREKKYGKVTEIRSSAGFTGRFNPDNWRVSAAMGGGAMYDMGVYPLNAARNAIGAEPIAVTARQYSMREEMFRDVDEFTEFELEFPGGVKAICETSFGKSTNYLDITCEKGSYRLRPFQSYGGVQGETGDGIKLPANPDHQQARQMQNDALAIIDNRAPIVPGEEGLADIIVVNAIQESSRKKGARIEL